MDGYIGEIKLFAGNFEPRNWAFCNGQLLNIASNTALFSIIGTIYGGDGRTNFGLPNLRGRVPMHFGTGAGLTPRDIGEASGVEHVTLVSSQMPAHSHGLAAAKTGGDTADPTSHVLASVQDATANLIPSYSTGLPNTSMHPSSIGIAGSNLSHENMQPYLAVNFIICTIGIFPSR